MPVRTTVFWSNGLQPVRQPKDVAFPEGTRGSRGRVPVPTDRAWDDFFDSPGAEIPEREPPTEQEREAF